MSSGTSAGLHRNHEDKYWSIGWLIERCIINDTFFSSMQVVQELQMNLMQYDYIPPVDIKTEPYIPETGETGAEE